MNKDERKRLEKLQEDARKGKPGGTFAGDANIAAFDLHLLLAEDETTQKLIRDICKATLKKALKNAADAAPEGADADGEPDLEDEAENSDGDDTATADYQAALALAQADLAQLRQSLAAEQTQRRELERKLKATPPPALPDALRGQLAPELALLKAVQADAELAQAWLHTDEVRTENEARQLVRLLAVLGDWDELQTLWSRLADRCKTHQRAATAPEHTVLATALALHNLRYRNRAAQLAQVAVGSPYHHETMERGTPKGSTVQAVWLPGLLNAAGQLQKQTLVQT